MSVGVNKGGRGMERNRKREGGVLMDDGRKERGKAGKGDVAAEEHDLWLWRLVL